MDVIKMANEEKSKVSFPIIPESNWWSIRNQFKKTLPSAVTVNYLKSLLGLTADQAARNLLYPLKNMGIIAEDGSPTPRANDWRNDSKYYEVCLSIVKDIYPQELLDLFPDNDIDKQKATEWFMSSAHLGEDTAKRTTALFVLLRDATVKIEPTGNSTSTKQKGERNKKIPQNKNGGEIRDTSVNVKDTIPKNPQASSEFNKNQLSMHIDLQIHISPEASLEQIDAIFASMAKHLYK
jgi:hypothetical protein